MTAYVSASNLDAVDFVAAALAALHAPQESVTVYVDESLHVEHGDGAEDFDPRLAIPEPRLARSPDGSVRQVVSTPEPTGRSRSPAAAFVSNCYRRLGIPNIEVVPRSDRELRGATMERALGEIGAWVDGSSVDPVDFSKGGAIHSGDRSLRQARWSEGELWFGPAPWISRSSLESGRGIKLRGPLDAFALAAEHRRPALHTPWYADVMALRPAGPSSPAGVDLVRSLFYRHSNRGPSDRNPFSGILLDEYFSLRHPIIECLVAGDLWLFDAVRWLAAFRLSTRERWAWSQAVAKSMTIMIRRERPADAPRPSLVANALDCAYSTEALAAELFDERRSSVARQRVVVASDHATQLVDEILRFFERHGVPEDFSNGGVELVDSRARLEALSLGNPGRAAAGLRSLVWRIVDLLLRAIMLIGDTLMRASLPVLAEHQADVRAVAAREKQTLAARLASEHVMVPT